MGDTPVAAFWRGFAEATGTDATYTAWAFGLESDPELATELGLLVRDGPKRATTSVLAEYDDVAEPLPLVGECSVILDGAGEPLCIIRTTEVETKPLGAVDDQFAWDEGEGDRSLAWWRRAHMEAFRKGGYPVDDDSLLVLERFELLWPDPTSSRG
jgi:uncharacterized protein YhfF